MWHVFIGDGDYAEDDPVPDWIWLSAKTPSWETAKAIMEERLERYGPDSCPHCREHAQEELVSLRASDGPEWTGFVEGDDYVIRQVPS